MSGGNPAIWTEALLESPLFSGLSSETLGELARAGAERRLDRGDVLLAQGDLPDALYVVLSGCLEVETRTDAGACVSLDEIGAGDVVGEIAVLLGGRRSATVRCLEASTVLRLPAGVVEQLLERDVGLAARFDDLLARRLRRVQLGTYLSDLFGPMSRAVLDEIEREIDWVRLPAGRVLFRRGDDPADGIYVLLAGRVRVVLDDEDGSEQRIAEVGRGECLGEMALLGDTARSATVYAVRDSHLARLAREAFDRLLTRHPDAMLQIARLLVARLRRTTGGLARVARAGYSFAVVPVSPDVATGAFAARLCEALSTHAETTWLSAERVGSMLGRPGIAQVSGDDPAGLRLAQWLVEQESSVPLVVYETDHGWSAWTERALRHADHVLLVAGADDDCSLHEVERRMVALWEPARVPRRSLVLLQDDDRRVYAGTDRWLARRDVDDHFHVRLGVADDAARLARLLTGCGVGLVLGGGGARGLAHIGVLRALRDLGVPIDAIGGTSMGALVAGCHAMGHGPDDLVELFRARTRRLLDPTFPILSLLSGHRMGRAFRQVFGEIRIEDLPVPFFCISTNLSRAEEVEHRRGSLSRAVRASVSLPGVLPPVNEAGDLLIDGGLLNNLPVDVMSRITGGGPTVAVDVSPDVDLRAAVDPGTEVSGWRMLWSRLGSPRHRVLPPGILSVLGRSVVVGSILAQRQHLAGGGADVFLPLPVGQWGMLEFRALDEIVHCGFEASLEPLRAWWESYRRPTA